MSDDWPSCEHLFVEDVEQMRRNWDDVRGAWDATVEQARSLPEPTVHERVGDEWSLVETLRHLVFASDAWLGGLIMRDENPYHPLGLPFSSFPKYGDADVLGLDLEARPTLDQIAAVKAERNDRYTAFLATLREDQLEDLRPPHPLVGWVDQPMPLKACAWTVPEEEFLHHGFATRDLATLTGEAW